MAFRNMMHMFFFGGMCSLARTMQIPFKDNAKGRGPDEQVGA